MAVVPTRNNFQLGIILLFGGIATIAIIPFAIYRFWTGNTLAGSVDLGILTCISATVLYAWRGGNVERAGLVVMLTSTAGGLLIVKLLGLAGLLWMYPILLANFLLVRRKWALLIAALAITVVVLEGSAFSSTLEKIMFLATTSVTTLFAMVFASRTESQRLRLESLAAHDTLTGTGNRLSMEMALRDAIAGRREDDREIGIAILDLDHFKRINDKYGHEVGDRVLVQFAALVQRSIRRSDRLFRYGGEEFVLLLPGVNAARLQQAAEQLRATVADELHDGKGHVTVSIGIAMLQPGEDWQTWLGRADAAMYRAKRAGRNRVEMDESEPAPASA